MSDSTSLTYGLTSGGFVRMRLPEITRSLFDAVYARTGVALDETPDTLMGQFVPIFAERLAEEWERLEQVYLSAYPATAAGTSLDLAVSYAGVTRLQSAAAVTRVVLQGTPGTTVPARSEIESTAQTPDGRKPPRFRLVDAVLISGAAAATMIVYPNGAITAGALYTFDWNSIRASAVAVAGDTILALLTRLAASLTAIGATAFMQNGNLWVTSEGIFSGAISSNLYIKAIGSPGRAEAAVPGEVSLEQYTLTKINSPVPGWDAVYNPHAFTSGSTIETDSDLRSRYKLGVFRLGSCTQPAIYANLRQDVAGIASLAVWENDTGATDVDGRPPHSVEVVIEGGDEQYIADRIYHLKAAGITAYGNTTVPVVGSDGYVHQIKFSRPEGRDVWLLVTLSQTNEEPALGDQAARGLSAIVEAGNKLQPSQDVFLQRLAAAVFPATSGVARVNIRAVAVAPNSAPPSLGAYQSTDIAIGPRQKALFSLARTVIG